MKVATYRCSCQQPWNITKIICYWHRTTLLASGISGTGRCRKVRNIIIIIVRRYVFSGSLRFWRKKIVWLSWRMWPQYGGRHGEFMISPVISISIISVSE